MITNPFDDVVAVDELPIWEGSTGRSRSGYLLWGDGVHVTGPVQDGRVPITARGRRRSGWVDQSKLGGKPLFEVYFIDVGQGDGILIRTPDFRHIMIDGGHPRRSQPSGKSAADFVDWKFFEDYGMDVIALDAMIASHNDYDHYGGLADLLDVAQEEELDCDSVSVEAFYHAGVSWWQDADGKRTLGPVADRDGERFFTQLLDDRGSLERGLGGGGPQFQGEWRRFLEHVQRARRQDGSPTPVTRLSSRTGNLPGFDQTALGAARVLAPVHFELNDQPQFAASRTRIRRTRTATAFCCGWITAPCAFYSRGISTKRARARS